MNKILVLFGAGNIGRSFIGQLFSRAKYEIVFVDINEQMIRALNERQAYRVVVKRNDRPDESIEVAHVRGVHGQDIEQVAEEIAEADVLATAVGKHALPCILPVLASGLLRRREKFGERPIDLIMAENVRHLATYMADELQKYVPSDYNVAESVGFVETSIGKMVPIMKEEDIRRDPLWVFAEAYNELIVDKHGFKNPIPDIPEIFAKENMGAFVDRKLFIHNLGHAASAYLGYQQYPKAVYIDEPLAHPALFQHVRACMRQSAVALNAAYPVALPFDELETHIDDLLQRFQNKALGDTIFRVGRDLPRKLDKEDRLIGEMLLAERHGCASELVAEVVLAACEFRATDEHGHLFPADSRFIEHDYPQGLQHILSAVCHLSPDSEDETGVMQNILALSEKL